MKHSILLAALGLTAFGAAAQEVGNVISSTPIVQQVAVPRQLCGQQPMVVQRQPSGAGSLLGAIAGAGVGNTIGHGSGHAAAIGIGAVAGALIGNNIESGGAYTQMVPQCTTETSYENRTVAWNVTYEYAGREYTVQMPYDPGPTVRLQVSPVGAQGGGYPPVAQAPLVTAPPPLTVMPAVVYGAAPAYPAYPAAYPAYPYPAYGPMYRPYPPISLSFGYVYHRGGHRHRWR
ncbi:MAG TPA: glycine zipper 2TM domain-containing protein [Ramlibacter sp.]|nr:glycine zipper 2TM domain-containing protein [Ramlibacter sp.]